MTANASFPKQPAHHGDELWAMPDDLDIGFDALISRYATHRLRNAEAIIQARPDLAEVIAPPEVTFAAYLADGSIVLCCPDGLPKTLLAVAEALDRKAPIVKFASQAATPPDLSAKLDELGRKLDTLQQDHGAGEQIVDRLIAIKSALLEGLAQVGKNNEPPAAPIPHGLDLAGLASRLEGAINHLALRADAPLEVDLTDIQQTLEETEVRILSFVRHTSQTSELAPQLEQIEQGIRQIMTAAAEQPSIASTLQRLEDRIESIADRTVPKADIAAQEQKAAHFLESIGPVMQRLDAAVDRMSTASTPAADQRLAAIEDQLIAISNRMEADRASRPDNEKLTSVLTDLRQEVGHAAALAPIGAASLQQISAQIEAMALRPDPVLDMTQQRQSFARFAEALGQAVRRLEATAQVIEVQSNTTAILAETKALREDLQIPLAKLDPVSDAIATLASQIAGLSHRPDPVLDLTEQQQSFAQFAIAISNAVRKIEDGAAKQQSIAHGLQDIAAQAILGLMASQKIAAEPLTSAVNGQHASPLDLMQTLRYKIAEDLAIEFQRHGWRPFNVVRDNRFTAASEANE